MRRPFWYVDNFIRVVTRVATRTLFPHEHAMLHSVAYYFGEHDQRRLNEQIQSDYFVHREGGGGRVVRLSFFDKGNLPPIQSVLASELVFQVTFSSAGKKRKAYVRFYEGYLLTLEFPKNSKTYHEANDFIIVSAEPTIDNKGHVEAIDRLEHGRDTPN